MIYLVDTSVVVKWVATEPQPDVAGALRGEHVIAPDLLRAELAQALYKKVKKAELTPFDALAGQAAVESLIEFLPSTGMSARALELSLELNHAAGDCFFLALAELLDEPLVTADLRFVETCRKTRYAPQVRPL